MNKIRRKLNMSIFENGLSKNKENNSKVEKEVQKEIIELCSSFPIYGK